MIYSAAGLSKQCLELVLLLHRALEQIKVMNERTPHGGGFVA